MRKTTMWAISLLALSIWVMFTLLFYAPTGPLERGRRAFFSSTAVGKGLRSENNKETMGLIGTSVGEIIPSVLHDNELAGDVFNERSAVLSSGDGLRGENDKETMGLIGTSVGEIIPIVLHDSELAGDVFNERSAVLWTGDGLRGKNDKETMGFDRESRRNAVLSVRDEGLIRDGLKGSDFDEQSTVLSIGKGFRGKNDKETMRFNEEYKSDVLASVPHRKSTRNRLPAELLSKARDVNPIELWSEAAATKSSRGTDPSLKTDVLPIDSNAKMDDVQRLWSHSSSSKNFDNTNGATTTTEYNTDAEHTWVTLINGMSFYVPKFKLDTKPPPEQGKKLRVICTLVKNDAEHVKEWIEFHTLAGFTKFVVFDHASSDGLDRVLNDFPKHMIDYHRIDWYKEFELNLKTNFMVPLQVVVYNWCFQKYWKQALVLTTHDVDEFIFPGRLSWDKPDPLLDAFQRRQLLEPKENATVSWCRCYRFETLAEKPPTGQVVQSYKRRRPYQEEFDLKSIPGLYEFCHTAGQAWRLCTKNPEGLWKSMYFPNEQKKPYVQPYIHSAQKNQTYVLARECTSLSIPNRAEGVVCNHIYNRYPEHVAMKNKKNGGDQYPFANFSLPFFRLFEQIRDVEAIDFVEHAQQRWRKEGRYPFSWNAVDRK